MVLYNVVSQASNNTIGASANLRDLKSKHQNGYGQPYFFIIFTKTE